MADELIGTVVFCQDVMFKVCLVKRDEIRFDRPIIKVGCLATYGDERWAATFYYDDWEKLLARGDVHVIQPGQVEEVK